MQNTDQVMNMTTQMIAESTAPHMNAAMTIPATAPAPHQYSLYMMRYSDRNL